MGAIKAVVAGMGVLIVVGFVVVAVTLVQRMQSIQTLQQAYSTNITLPTGSRVVETAIGDGHILLRLTLTGGGEALTVIDTDSGRELGHVTLIQAAP